LLILGKLNTFTTSPAFKARHLQSAINTVAVMTLTELKYIVAVAREKHFGKAADACYVSQPTLSVAIKKLEQELDVKLFERSANEVTVTARRKACWSKRPTSKT
jgi:DNA-binding MarR family transcriptional regulator